MANNVFKKYRARIAREGILKSILLSACIGLGALSLTVLFSWFFGFKGGLYVGLGLLVGLTALLAPLFYYKLYRPTTKAIAKRVDELGLEERVLTMVELENDPSYIAMRQREDTLKALGSVDHMLVKIAVSAALVITFGVGVLLGCSAITVGSLYVADVIPSGVSLVSENVLPKTFTLTYSVSSSGGGSIVMYTDDWSNEQSVSEEVIVTEGEDAPAVLAVEDDKHIFVGWSDGVTEAYRQDVNVKGNMDVQAIFLKYAENVEDAESDRFAPPDIYREPRDNDNQDGETDPDAPPWPGSESTEQLQDPENLGGGGNGPGGATQSDMGNQIIDGQTFYGDTYEDAHSEAMDRLGSDESMDDGLKDSISDYYDSIQQDSSKTGDGEGEGESEGGGD